MSLAEAKDAYFKSPGLNWDRLDRFANIEVVAFEKRFIPLMGVNSRPDLSTIENYWRAIEAEYAKQGKASIKTLRETWSAKLNSGDIVQHNAVVVFSGLSIQILIHGNIGPGTLAVQRPNHRAVAQHDFRKVVLLATEHRVLLGVYTQSIYPVEPDFTYCVAVMKNQSPGVIEAQRRNVGRFLGKIGYFTADGAAVL